MNTFTIVLVGLVCLYFYVLSGFAFVRLLCPPYTSKAQKLFCGVVWPLMLPLSAGHEVGYARLEKNIINSDDVADALKAYCEVLYHATDGRMSKVYTDSSVVISVIDEVRKQRSDRILEILIELRDSEKENEYKRHVTTLTIEEIIQKIDEECLFE